MTLEPSSHHETSEPAAPRVRPRRPRRILLVAALLLGVMTPLVLSAGPAGATAAVHHRTVTERKIVRAVERLINNQRRAHGLRIVHMAPRLRVAARRHNIHMSRANLLSHQVSGEASIGARADNAGYHWTWVGENIGWNSRMTMNGVLLLQRIMYHERAPYNGHRQNILSRHYRNVGIDVYMDRGHHKVWLTTDFGRK